MSATRAAAAETPTAASGTLRPVVVVSECLGFAAVRYNGQVLSSRFVQALDAHVRFVVVCPEVAIGLGVPREPIRLVADGDRVPRLVQPATGLDLGDEMRSWSDGWLADLGPVDGFILKSRSPSCGIKDVKIYPPEPGKPAGSKGQGVFAEAVRRAVPHAVLEDEGRLTNFRIRHHFLTRLYAAARLRAVRDEGRMAALVAFHTAYKLQLMAYSPGGLRELGRIVANPERRPVPEVMDAYAERFAGVTSRLSRVGTTVNVLQHAVGYVSDGLEPAERAYFAELIDEYRADRLPLSAVLSVLRAWIVRFGVDYLAGQRFFEPYPRPLLELTDSGR